LDFQEKGVFVDTLANRFQRTPSTRCGVLAVLDVDRPQEQRLDYIYHPSFDDAGQEATILAPMPGAEDYQTQCQRMKVPNHVSPELAPLYTPLLNKEQEQHLFRKMNFLKHKAVRLRGQLRFPTGCMEGVKERKEHLAAIEDLERQAQALKAHLINCNMRLVVSIAKQYATRTDNFSELLSDGHVSLISAVERFDYSRGTKLSTYASWAIMKNCARSIAKEKHRRRRYRTGQRDWFFEAAADPRSDEQTSLALANEARDCVCRLLELLNFLDPREQQIIRLRTGLDSNAKRVTLEKIGKRLGITKERVRQLQSRAIRKLRNLAAANNVQLP
jgi:RNA polymerase sigma factor (sigma-70 family)